MKYRLCLAALTMLGTSVVSAAPGGNDVVSQYRFTDSLSISAQTSSARANNNTCAIVTAAGATIAAAREQFTQACPGRVRRDCDPVSGRRWMCSTDNITASTPVQASSPTQQPAPAPAPAPQPTQPTSTPSNPPSPSQPNSSGTCTIVSAAGASVAAARQQFAQQCPGRRVRDCDPVSGRRWMCSTDNITANTPVQPVLPLPGAEPDPAPQPAPQPTPQPTPTPAEPQQPSTPATGGACTARGSSIREAIRAYAAACPGIPRKDCDPIGNGDWLCSSANINGSAPSGGGNPPANPPQAPTQPTRRQDW